MNKECAEGFADRYDITLDAALRKLLRAERQRQFGADLAQRTLVDEDRAWIASSNATVARALG